MTSRAENADGNALCQACGLCCRGVWFSHVKLDEDEVEPARRIGINVEFADGQAKFQQPCVMHDGNGCTVYQTWRPRPCIKYRCSLLIGLDAREVTIEAALRHVANARVMSDRVENEAGSVVGGLLGAEFMGRLETRTEGSAGKPLSSSAKLDAVALRVYFSKYFDVVKPLPKDGV